MRYAKGTIVITEERDIPLLRHVRNARFVSHEQLFELMSLDCLGSCRTTFNRRIRRLLKTGHIERLAEMNWQRSRVYFITAYGLSELETRGEFLMAMHSGNRQKPDPLRAAHALELNGVRLGLARSGLLAGWVSEVEISSANMLANMVGAPSYAKDYDAVVKVWAGSEVREFALEYERSLKSVKRYEKISELLESEQRVPSVLYLTANPDILMVVASCLASPSQRVAFASARSFEQSLLGTAVATDSSGDLVSLDRFLRYAHPLYRSV
jgi:hypothetical protein